MERPPKFRRDSAGEPFEAEISHHRPTIEISVCAGQNMFFANFRHPSIRLGVFELYYDI